MTEHREHTIDRTSPVPLYFQLARRIRHDIATGRWPAGQRITSEPEIGEQYGVSRATVRQALFRLEREGLIQRLKGRGTFVSNSRERSWLLQSSNGFFQEELERTGSDVTSETLRAEVAELPEWAATALGLSEGSHGAVLERLRFVDGQPALYVADYLPTALAQPVLALANRDGSLYDLIEAQAGPSVHGGRRTLEATKAEPAVADMLGVGRRAPVIFIESVAWDADMRPFHAFQSWLRSDRIQIEVEIVRTSSDGSADAPGT